MGTWSRPLFATVDVGTPDDYIIDTSLMSPSTLAEWNSTAFFDREPDKTRWTLTEFMNTGCETHKIMDYMDSAQKMRWKSLIQQLYATYPTLGNVAFHFFCRDGHFPYYLTMNRDDPRSLDLYYGHCESYRYFRPSRGVWPWQMREEDLGEFLPDAYLQGYRARTLNMECLIMDLTTPRLW